MYKWSMFVWFCAAVLTVVIFSLFLAFFIKLALFIALIALAYYWFTRAQANRGHRHRPHR